MAVMTTTAQHLAMLQADRPPCPSKGFVASRELADMMARGTGMRPFLCQVCYRFHLARCVPHLVPGAGKWFGKIRDVIS